MLKKIAILAARVSPRLVQLVQKIIWVVSRPSALQIMPCFRYEHGKTWDEKTSFFNNYPVTDLKAPYVCTSQMCNMEFFGLPLFQYWMNQLKITPQFHRKHWELVYIIQTLYENGMLKPGKRGLVFACGLEPLPSLFASLGCEILATDLDMNDVRAAAWVDSNQNTMNSVAGLNNTGLCPPELFNERVTYQPMDMNRIPEEIHGQFDFNWSTCAAEHIGGMEQSINFLSENIKTLKIGGLAVHTFEFNLSSNSDICLLPDCFIFRKCDVEKVAAMLHEQGHEVFPLNFKTGPYLADRFVDIPPYWTKNLHLRLMLGNYISTSFGLIVRKMT